MLINIPDELVNRLVTSTDVKVETAAALAPLRNGVEGNDATNVDSRRGDIYGLHAARGKAFDDQTAAVQDLKHVVYKAATGKGLPEGA